MAEETITILRVGTDEAVKSINDLKNNISILKKNLGDLEVGTEEYKDTLDELKVNQNALKDAMYATSSSMEDVAKAATGTGESYNALVHNMASLKEEFRSTTDVMRRAELGQQIKDINDQLKAMDALQGNYQRNVGNYAGSIKEAFSDMAKNMAEKTDVFKKSLGAVGGGLNGMKDGLEGISKSPAVASIGLLVSIALKLADSLKDNETAMEAVKKAMASLKPVMDFFSNILEKVAEVLADVIGKVTEFISTSGILDKVIKGVMGVGNAILQYVIAPFKGVIAAIKVFKEQGVKGLGDAARAFGQEMKSGISFKQNFQAGQTAAETMMAGAKAKKKEVKETGKELGKETKDGFLEELNKLPEEIDKAMEADLAAIDKAMTEANKKANDRVSERIKALEKAYDHQLELNSILVEDERERADKEYAIQEEANQKKLSLLQQFTQEALERGDIDAYLQYQQESADLEVEIETDKLREKERLRKQDLKDAQDKAKREKDLLKGVASATSSILGTIADLYESDEEGSEKHANRIKGLRIAAATVDTISGAIGAYMQAVETIPPPYGIITGAIQAATVTAAGIAQIAQMKATKVSATAGTSSAPTPAVQSAPALVTEVSNVRSLTSATEEERLNQMASDQRVYILASDIEASQNQIKTQVAESSF